MAARIRAGRCLKRGYTPAGNWECEGGPMPLRYEPDSEAAMKVLVIIKWATLS